MLEEKRHPSETQTQSKNVETEPSFLAGIIRCDVAFARIQWPKVHFVDW